MSKTITTKHHPVPESLLGDYSHPIPQDDHETYHRACGFYAPDMILRNLAYSGFRRNGRSLPVNVSRRILDVLTPPHWRDVYEDDTFFSKEKLQVIDKNKERQSGATYHLMNFFTQEQEHIVEAIGRLSGYSSSNGALTNVNTFFRTNHPATSIRRMSSERQGKEKVRKWVEPMQKHILLELEEATKDVAVENLTRAARVEAIRLLTQQKAKITEYQTWVIKQLTHFSDVLAKMGSRKSMVNVHKYD